MSPHGVGEERLVNDDQTISFASVRYSTPPGHVGTKVWCRIVGEELVVTARHGTDLVELVRHRISTPGAPRILDEHYPGHPDGRSVHRPVPKPRTEAEIAFLAIGPGAERWLIEAGPAGAVRIRSKMARAVELATVVGAALVDQALGLAAMHGRFADDDLPAIIDHLDAAASVGITVRADEAHSVQPGTGGWQALGQ